MQGVELLEVTGEDPLIGTLIGDRYRILRKLGEGGMGRVYEAEHVLIKRRVAIKCLHAQYANDGAVVARFHREALAATSIGHEHIVEVTDMGRFPDGAVFMALEFLDGRDLAAEIEKNGPLTIGRAARIMAQICDALSAAHAKGIIHRDLKPENIFLIARGTNPDFVKVVDFGISKFKDAEGKGMTGTGVMIGTPLFMSPEQIEGHKDIDQRADLYSMGVILFTMLTGRVPIDAQSIPRLVYQVCVVKAPSVREFREDIPAGLDALIARLLEKDRALRFPDAASLRAELEPWLAIDTPVGPMLSPSPSAPSGIRSVPGPVSSPDTLGATGIQETPAPLHQPTPAPDALPRPTPSLVPTAVAAEVSRTPRVEVMMGLTAALVLLSIGVGVAINSLNKSMPPIVTPPVVTPVAPTARPAEPVAPDPAPTAPPVAAAAPREVHVTLRVQPEDAELWVDGSRVLTPYDGTLDVGAHDLEVRRDGYRTLVLRRVAIRNPQTIELRLQRGRGHQRGPVFGQLATDDAGVSRVEVIRAPTAEAAGSEAPSAHPSETPAASAPPTVPPSTPEPVEPGRTSINDPF